MKPVTQDEILDLAAYEKVRDEKRTEAIALRKLRRVHLGELLALSFETHFTIWYQIQEMIRAERLVDDSAIQFELDTYNPLIPGEGELSATLFIEIVDQDELRSWLPKLPGIEHATRLEIEGAGASRGVGEGGRSKEEITSTVHYIRFAVTAEQREAMAAGNSTRLVVDHPEYSAVADLDTELVRSLAADIA